jgi:hypothetical protein
MKRIRVNWDLFRMNSSTEEALYLIALGEIKNWGQWLEATWPEACKAEIKRLRKARVSWKSIRRRATRLSQNWGF